MKTKIFRVLVNDGTDADYTVAAESAADAISIVGQLAQDWDWNDSNSENSIYIDLEAIEVDPSAVPSNWNGKTSRVCVADEDSYVVGGERAEARNYEIEPPQPRCSASAHDWRSPHVVVGGLEDNPGVWASGGGVEIVEVCAACGRYRETDTWAQNPDNGDQGLRSVKYREADETSLSWIAREAEGE